MFTIARPTDIYFYFYPKNEHLYQQHPFCFTLVPPLLLPACNLMPPPPAPPIESGIIIWLFCSLAIPFLTIPMNASETCTPSLADVSKYAMSLFSLHQALAFSALIFLSDSLSTLLPIRTNGNDFGSSGPAFSMNPSFHLSRASKLAAFVKSKQSAQQSAPR
mgnify:FL=1|jgi:hypothetical protein